MRQSAKVADIDPTLLARVAIGVAVKEGYSVPDISTVSAFRQTLMQARKIAYIDPASGGSSGVYLDSLFEKWGIRKEIHNKAVLVNGGLVATRLLDGTADLAIHQISEIKVVPHTHLVGPLPKEIQNYTEYAVITGPQPKAATLDLLTFLLSPSLKNVLLEKGMEP